MSITLGTLVMTVITAFSPTSAGTLRQTWTSAQLYPLSICLQINQIFARGGKHGVITVRCDPLSNKESAAP